MACLGVSSLVSEVIRYTFYILSIFFIIFFLASVQHMTLFQVGIFGLKYRHVQCCSRPLDLYYSNNTAHHTVAFEACLVDGCCVSWLLSGPRGLHTAECVGAFFAS